MVNIDNDVCEYVSTDSIVENRAIHFGTIDKISYVLIPKYVQLLAYTSYTSDEIKAERLNMLNKM